MRLKEAYVCGHLTQRRKWIVRVDDLAIRYHLPVFSGKAKICTTCAEEIKCLCPFCGNVIAFGDGVRILKRPRVYPKASMLFGGEEVVACMRDKCIEAYQHIPEVAGFLDVHPALVHGRPERVVTVLWCLDETIEYIKFGAPDNFPTHYLEKLGKEWRGRSRAQQIG